jgi:glycosyltransferase involved in cell wall biosynthesis
MITSPPKILAVVPARNAAAHLPELIRRIAVHLPADDTLIVNDGSTDASARIIAESGCRTVTFPHNRGKGAALRAGFGYAIRHGYEAVITLDADLQHPPEYLPRLLALYGQADLVVGTRVIGSGGMPWPRVISNTLSSLVISVMGKTGIHDSQSGFRLIPVAVLKRLRLAADGFEAESELLFQAGRLGLTVTEVPIPAVYAGSASFIRPLWDTGRFLRQAWRRLWY